MAEKTPGDVDMTGEDSEPEIVSSPTIEEMEPDQDDDEPELQIAEPGSDDIAEVSGESDDSGTDDISEHSENSDIAEEQETSEDETSEVEGLDMSDPVEIVEENDDDDDAVVKNTEQSEEDEPSSDPVQQSQFSEVEPSEDDEDPEIEKYKEPSEDEPAYIADPIEEVKDSLQESSVPVESQEIPEPIEFVSLDDALVGAEQDLELLPQQTRERLTALWHQHSMAIKHLKSAQQLNEENKAQAGRRMAGEKLSLSESEGPYVLDVVGGVSGVDEKTAAVLTKEQEALEEQNVDTLTEALHRKRQEVIASMRERDDMRLQAEELERQLQRREQELQRVLSENSTLSTQLTSAISAKCEALMQSQHVASKEAHLQHKERCMEQQLELLHSQIRQMTEQMREQGEELAQVRQSTGFRNLQLENDLQIKTEQLRASEEAASRLQESLCEEQRRVEALQDKLRDSRDSEIALQETHNQQIQAKTRLVQLYQEESRDAHSLAEQYTSAVKELQAALREASDKFGELETNSEKEKAKYNADLEKHKQAISTLKQELKNANMLLEQSHDASMDQQVSLISPAASVARKLAQSGFTLTQVYNQYVATAEELELTKTECVQLRENMDTIIKQLEERAPQFASDRDMLRRIQQENVRLLTEHDAMLHQCEEVKNEAHQERRRACKLEREKNFMQQQIEDLSKQVIVLLREVDALKHRSLPPSLNLSNTYDGEADKSTSDVVSRRLVPFRDVDELQRRNFELLAVVRELSSKAETEEQAAAAGQDVSVFSARLDEALLELRDVQEREEQHSRLMEQLLQQRNHYRDLALQAGPGVNTQEVALSPMKFDPSSPLKRSSSVMVEDTEVRNKLRLAEESLNVTKQQLEQQKRDSESKYQELNKQLEALNAQTADDRVAKAKLSVVCEHKEQKLTSVQAKVLVLVKQLEAETKKCKAKSDASDKYMKMASDLQKECNSLHSQLRQTQVALQSVESELERVRYVESSLQQECHSLQRSLKESRNVQKSIDEMKAMLERTSVKSNAILIRQLEEANLESRGLRKQLQEEGVRLGEELTQLQNALTRERTALEQARSDTARAKAEVTRAAERHAQTERDIQAMRAHRNPSVDTAAQTEVCVSEEVLREKRNAQQVAELEQQRSVLQSELSLSQSRVSELTGIVEATETALRHVREASEQASKASAERLQESQQEIEQLQARLGAFEAELCKVREMLAAAEKQAAEKVIELQKIEAKADEALHHQRDAQEKCQALQSALEASEAEARATGERLTLELQQHTEQKLAHETLKQQILSEVESRKALSAELEESKRQLTVVESQVLEKEAALETAGSEKEQQIHDLQSQNTALLDQVQLMGAELCALKQQTLDTSVNTSLNLSSSFAEDSATPEQLLQVLRYLRTEKSNALSRNEILCTQNAELKAKLDSLQEQLQQMLAQNSQLDASAPSVVTRARYDELLRRLEVLNALSESSSRQREACVTLRKENTELQARLALLTSQLETYTSESSKAAEKIETLQVELTAVRGEAGRWRTCANQLTERANRANPEEQKRLLQERENLQRQLASEREELRKAKLIVNERDGELNRLRTELAQLQNQHKVVQDEIARTTQNLAQKEQAYCDLVNKEMQVRRIAKKYKTQFEELTKSVEEGRVRQEGMANVGAQEQALAKQQYETRISEIEARAANAEKEKEEAHANLVTEQTKCNDLAQQLENKNKEIEVIQKDMAAANEKSERAKQILNNARQKINNNIAENISLKQEVATLKQSIATLTQNNAALSQTNAAAQQSVTDLQTKLQTLEQNKDEDNVRRAALATQFEGKVARLERELADRVAEVERLQQQQQQQTTQAQQQARVTKQVIKVASSGVDKSSAEPPTANIRPMAGPSQSKPQQSQQSAAVTPTSRSAPMARLRPMSMASPRTVAVLAPSQQTLQQQQQQQQASSSVAAVVVQPEPSTSSTQQVSQANTQGSSSSSQSAGAASGQASSEVSATVLLVRPQEVQPAVSSSQSLLSTSVPTPTTSQQPTPTQAPTLKRLRDTEASSQEPMSKHVRTEVTSASVEPAEEPSSSLHSAPDEVIIVDSGEDTEAEEEDEGEGVEEDEEAEDYAEDEEDEGECYEQEDETEPQDNEDDQFEAEEGNEEDQESPQEQDDNEVIILEEPPELPPGLAGLLQEGGREPLAPEPSSSSAPVMAQAHLTLPLQQGYEEVGDDGIVPSTPTLFVPRRREGFGEGVSSPQVPQAQGRAFTFAPESSHTSISSAQGVASESLEEARLDQMEDNGSGRSVPSTPLLVSPQEVGGAEVEVDLADPDLGSEGESNMEVATSSVPAILVTPANDDTPQLNADEQDMESDIPQLESTGDMESPVIPSDARVTPRGGNRARRSGTRAGTGRPSGRPTPIVWDHSQSQQQRGTGRGMPEGGRGATNGRRARASRAGFQGSMRF